MTHNARPNTPFDDDFTARLDALRAKTLDDLAEQVIIKHKIACETDPAWAEPMFLAAMSECRTIMKAACNAPAEADMVRHINRIMLLADYRIPGQVERSRIDEIMTYATASERQRAFVAYFTQFTD